MSVRRRSIAGSPERTASAAASTVTDMITETLIPAPAIDAAVVADELHAAKPAIRSLIAAKELGEKPVVLVADPLRLEIRVVCGAKAIGIDEQLGKVAGAAQASGWSLHVPPGATLGSWVTDALAPLAHITTDPAPAASKRAAESASEIAIDLDALRSVGRAGR
jgi:hypothetical protein